MASKESAYLLALFAGALNCHGAIDQKVVLQVDISFAPACQSVLCPSKLPSSAPSCSSFFHISHSKINIYKQMHLLYDYFKNQP